MRNDKVRKSILVLSITSCLLFFSVPTAQASLSNTSNINNVTNSNVDCEDYGIKCWVVGKVTKRLLKSETDLSRKQIRKIRNVVVELCNELDKE